MGTTTALVLHPLREDLKIFRSTSTHDGYPTWQLFDPLQNRYFRVGWSEFELLSRWHLLDSYKIIDDINQNTTLRLSLQHIEQFWQFLVINHLVDRPGDQTLAQMTRQYQATKQQLWQRIKQSYLFFKVKLFNPERWLDLSLPWLRWLFTRYFCLFMCCLTCLTLYFVSRQWSTFTYTFSAYFNWQGMFYYIVAIFFVKIIHEFGHAYTAKYYGMHVTNMGIAFLVCWPVLYTDTSDAWRLTSRRARLAIDAGGVIAELYLASLLLFIWCFLSNGLLRDICFFIATTSWLLSLLINANPLMRFDGYYFLTDYWQVDNLQQQSFALARWGLRRVFFGIVASPPYELNRGLRRRLICYAVLTWLYRLVLYITIAWLIYHFIVKIVGVLLMFATIINLVVLPILQECRQIFARRKAMSLNKNTLMTFAMLCLLLVLFFIPWHSTVVTPALLRYQQETKLYLPEPARLKLIKVTRLQSIKRGQMLMQFVAPQINFHVDQLVADISSLKIRIRQDLQDQQRQSYRIADERQLAAKQSEYQGLLRERDQLVFHAPFNGVVTYMNEQLRQHHWLARDSLLLELVNPNRLIIEAYIPEQDLYRIKIGDKAKFYTTDSLQTLPATVYEIDKVSVEKFNEGYLASVAGGSIAVNQNEQGDLLPQQAYYRVILVPVQRVQLNQVTRGRAIIEAERVSLATRLWRSIQRLLVRESGF